MCSYRFPLPPQLFLWFSAALASHRIVSALSQAHMFWPRNLREWGQQLAPLKPHYYPPEWDNKEDHHYDARPVEKRNRYIDMLQHSTASSLARSYFTSHLRDSKTAKPLCFVPNTVRCAFESDMYRRFVRSPAFRSNYSDEEFQVDWELLANNGITDPTAPVQQGHIETNDTPVTVDVPSLAATVPSLQEDIALRRRRKKKKRKGPGKAPRLPELVPGFEPIEVHIPVADFPQDEKERRERVAKILRRARDDFVKRVTQRRRSSASSHGSAMKPMVLSQEDVFLAPRPPSSFPSPVSKTSAAGNPRRKSQEKVLRGNVVQSVLQNTFSSPGAPVEAPDPSAAALRKKKAAPKGLHGSKDGSSGRRQSQGLQVLPGSQRARDSGRKVQSVGFSSFPRQVNLTSLGGAARSLWLHSLASGDYQNQLDKVILVAKR